MRNLAAFALLILMFHPPARAAGTAPPPPDVKCGAYCAFVGLKALGLVEGPYSAFEKTIPPPGPSGYSMEELDRIAKGRGAATLAVEADLEALATLSRPNACIGFVDQHFLIIKWINLETKTVSLIDPPREYDLPFGEFAKRFTKRSLVLGPPSTPPTLVRSIPWLAILGWSSAAVASLALLGGVLARKSKSGVALVALMVILGSSAGCDTKATPAAPSPRPALGLKIEPADYKLGKVFASTPDRKISLENRLVNESARPIRVLEVRKSCTCTSSTLESTTIPVGGSTKLTSTFELGSRPGPNRVRIELIVDVPDASSRIISYDWDVVTPMFAEVPTLDFGRLEPTQRAERRVALMDRGLATCPDCRLVVDPDHGSIGAEVGFGREPDPSGHPTGLDVPGPGRPLGSLLVSIRPGGDPGDYHQGVSVSLKCGGIDRAKLELPVDWSVRPSVEAQPSRLWLGECPSGSKVSRRITLRSNDGLPPLVDRLSSEPVGFLSESKVSAGPDDSSAIDLTFSIMGDPGLRRGGLTVFLGGEKLRTVVVPVSYLVPPAVPVAAKP